MSVLTATHADSSKVVQRLIAARELPRLAKVDAARANRMQILLDAWPSADTGTE